MIAQNFLKLSNFLENPLTTLLIKCKVRVLNNDVGAKKIPPPFVTSKIALIMILADWSFMQCVRNTCDETCVLLWTHFCSLNSLVLVRLETASVNLSHVKGRRISITCDRRSTVWKSRPDGKWAKSNTPYLNEKLNCSTSLQSRLLNYPTGPSNSR